MIKVQNTLSGKKEEFHPRDKGKVGMYVCGPTVYNYIHIGNARAYIAFDVIHRWLEYRDYEVTYVRNLTDVDDKIINKANEENVSVEEITKKFSKAFHDDMGILGIKPPEIEPKATETIEEMIEMVAGLIEKGLAYEVDGDVFYRIKAFKDYGKLAKRSLEEMEAGKRVEVDPRKKHPMDFSLWKKAKEGEPAWDSPWGKGRPGWHIECSAMSLKYLGADFDIHGGGQDLIFPHHENEIAQSEGYTGKKFARYWLHNGFVNIEQEKMAKSLGNVILIKDLEEKYKDNLDGLRNDIRMLFLGTGYHGPISFSYSKLDKASTAVKRIQDFLRRIDFFIQKAPEGGKHNGSEAILELTKKFRQNFEDDMDDDFNTPQAISRIFDLVKNINTILDKKTVLSQAERKSLQKASDSIMNLASIIGFNFEARIWIPGKIKDVYVNLIGNKPENKNQAVERLLEERESARQKKDYSKSDSIRDELESIGLTIEDTPFGPRI